MAETLVEDYLARLRAAAAVLPADRGAELVRQISDHIAEARAAGLTPDEAALRTLLDRLGHPQEIVAAAQDSEDLLAAAADPLATGLPAAADPAVVRRGIGWEVAAVLLMTLGSIVPLLGWGAGVVLLWTSRRWRTTEKLVATAFFPLGPFGVVLLAGVALAPTKTCTTGSSASAAGGAVPEATTCTGFALPPVVGYALLAAWVIVPFVIAGVLLKRAADRAAADPPL